MEKLKKIKIELEKATKKYNLWNSDNFSIVMLVTMGDRIKRKKAYYKAKVEELERLLRIEEHIEKRIEEELLLKTVKNSSRTLKPKTLEEQYAAFLEREER